MEAKPFVVLTLLALTALLVGAVSAQGAQRPLAAAAPSAKGFQAVDPQARVADVLDSSPVMFIENVGQFADGARFQVRGGDHTLWLAEDALWMTVLEQRSEGARERGNKGVVEDSLLHLRASAPESRRGVNIRLTFPGANPHPRLEPFGRLETSVNYFLGDR